MVIGNRAYKFLLRHHVLYSGSPHVVRLKCEDRSHLTLSFAFSRSFWVRVDDLHVIFLGSVGPSCEKNLYKAILSLHVQASLRVHSMVTNKILAGIKFGSARANRQTAKLNSPPNFPAIRYSHIPRPTCLVGRACEQD